MRKPRAGVLTCLAAGRMQTLPGAELAGESVREVVAESCEIFRSAIGERRQAIPGTSLLLYPVCASPCILPQERQAPRNVSNTLNARR